MKTTRAPGAALLGDSTLVAWYPPLYAPRMGGAHDSHHRTAGIAEPHSAARRQRGRWRHARSSQDLPVIGYLNYGSPESDTLRLTGLRRGLNQFGYVEGRNLVIEYRWAGNQADRLPALVADLIQLQVTVIVAAGVLPARAAKAATTDIPIVFIVGADPVQLGLVASLNRPGGNLTGFNVFDGELEAKALALLHELVIGAPAIEQPEFHSPKGGTRRISGVFRRGSARRILRFLCSAHPDQS